MEAFEIWRSIKNTLLEFHVASAVLLRTTLMSDPPDPTAQVLGMQACVVCQASRDSEAQTQG